MKKVVKIFRNKWNFKIMIVILMILVLISVFYSNFKQEKVRDDLRGYLFSKIYSAMGTGFLDEGELCDNGGYGSCDICLECDFSEGDQGYCQYIPEGQPDPGACDDDYTGIRGPDGRISMSLTKSYRCDGEGGCVEISCTGNDLSNCPVLEPDSERSCYNEKVVRYDYYWECVDDDLYPVNGDEIGECNRNQNMVTIEDCAINDKYCAKEDDNYKCVTCLADGHCSPTSKDELIQGPHCFDDDIYEVWNIFKCLNQGTSSSTCQSLLNDYQLIQKCTPDAVCIYDGATGEPYCQEIQCLLVGCPQGFECDTGLDICSQCIFYEDNDLDGFGNPSVSSDQCGLSSIPFSMLNAPAGYVEDNSDCNDNDASIYPGAEEICSDGIDQDCDMFADEDCSSVSVSSGSSGGSRGGETCRRNADCCSDYGKINAYESCKNADKDNMCKFESFCNLKTRKCEFDYVKSGEEHNECYEGSDNGDRCDGTGSCISDGPCGNKKDGEECSDQAGTCLNNICLQQCEYLSETTDLQYGKCNGQCCLDNSIENCRFIYGDNHRDCDKNFGLNCCWSPIEYDGEYYGGCYENKLCCNPYLMEVGTGFNENIFCSPQKCAVSGTQLCKSNILNICCPGVNQDYTCLSYNQEDFSFANCGREQCKEDEVKCPSKGKPFKGGYLCCNEFETCEILPRSGYYFCQADIEDKDIRDDYTYCEGVSQYHWRKKWCSNAVENCLIRPDGYPMCYNIAKVVSNKIKTTSIYMIRNKNLFTLNGKAYVITPYVEFKIPADLTLDYSEYEDKLNIQTFKYSDDSGVLKLCENEFKGSVTKRVGVLGGEINLNDKIILNIPENALVESVEIKIEEFELSNCYVLEKENIIDETLRLAEDVETSYPNRTNRIVIYSGILVVLIFIFIWLRFFRKKQKVKRKIRHKKKMNKKKVKKVKKKGRFKRK